MSSADADDSSEEAQQMQAEEAEDCTSGGKIGAHDHFHIPKIHHPARSASSSKTIRKEPATDKKHD